MAMTEQEKKEKRARDSLKLIHNRILAAFSLKQITDWHSLYKHMGYDQDFLNKNPNKPLSFQELKNFLSEQKAELEERLAHERSGNVPATNTNDGGDRSSGTTVVPSQTVEVQADRGIDSIPYKQIAPPTGTADYNNCTVLALSATLDLPYEKANEYLNHEGRVYKEGLRADWLSEFLLSVGFQLVNREVGIPIRKALEICKNGRYYVLVNGRQHALSIVDGVVYDIVEPEETMVVERIYKLEPKIVEAELKVMEKKEEPLDAKNDYGLVPSPNEKVFWYWFQKKALHELKVKVIDEERSGVLVLAPTGTGKTFLTYGLVRRLLDCEYHEGKTWSHIPYLVLTKSTIVEQHKRVCEKFFNIHPAGDIEVTNIEALRSKAGQLWIKEELKIENGVEVERFVWKKNIHPCVVLLDESQGVKNRKAKQSRIIRAYTEIPSNACLVSISATPFVRVTEAQAFAVSTHRPLEHLGFPKGTRLTNETWPAYAAIIASPAKPDDYNQAAIERLMKDLEPWIVRVRGVRPQFDAINGVKIIEFETDEARKQYAMAWEKFQERKRKADALVEAGKGSSSCYLVILLAFAMEAEVLHADHIARRMDEAVRKKGKASVAAPKFKQTLIRIVELLITKYGWSRDDISLVWGGGQTQLTEKQKTKQKIKEKQAKLEEMGMSVDEMLDDLDLKDVEDRVIKEYPEEWRLGAQDQDERQREIDRFQSGKTLFCIYTLKSGGVGLSLHHTDELTTFKCRRKESGYAVEEDIPKVPVRPRETFAFVSYNAIELVQGVGRVPRLTSLSPTVQNIYCYAGTIEVSMGRIYSQKLRCLSSVVKQKEDWQGIIFGGQKREELVEQVIKRTEGVENDESSLIDEGDAEEEEENGD